MNEFGFYICPACGKRSNEYGKELNDPQHDSYWHILHIHFCPYCDDIGVVYRRLR